VGGQLVTYKQILSMSNLWIVAPKIRTVATLIQLLTCKHFITTLHVRLWCAFIPNSTCLAPVIR